MRVTLDATGTDISAWTEALRRESHGEEIQVFHASAMTRMFGSAGLDFAIRGTDVFHASGLTPCAPRRVKLTATIEDLSCWLMPESHTPAQIRTAELFAENILVRADGLVAVSEAARRDAIRILGIPPEKITIIYPGVEAGFFDARPTPRDRPYVLCAGDREPRGNFTTLLEAWNGLKPELRRDYDLVTFDATPAAELPGLMAGATLFAHLPFHDSFALPVAQAMAAQVAVLISDTSGLPEVGRDAGIMVDPHSPSAIAAALTRLLESEPERAKLARYGRARAEKYRWEKCAAESLAFFHRVLGKQ
jgi:glycosyltransferase involved in cell wall biosynthesis